MNNILFEELGLSENMLKNLDRMGFHKTTPVQGKAIPPMMDGLDVTVQAPTGTGKTCAFGVPAVEKADPKNRSVQSLILCPTRELAIQTAAVLHNISRNKPGVKIVAVYGGERIERQFMALRGNPQIVVATPGRMLDHLRRGTVRISQLKLVVLDEADRMLDMGFRDDLDAILETVPSERQTALFSATISPEIKEIAKKYQKDSLLVRIAQEALTVDSVEQYYTEIRGKNKTDALISLLREKRFYLSLVFVGKKSMADELAGNLSGSGFKAEALHGDLRQSQRDMVMGKFRRGQIEVLVATDVAARGIDVMNVDAVVNYDIPQEADSYVHRIGRTGRADKTGVAYTFICLKERKKLREIIAQTKTKILYAPIGVSTASGELPNTPEPLDELPVQKPRGNRPDTRPRINRPASPSDKDVRMFLSIGSKDDLNIGKVLDLIRENSGIPVKNVGKISIHDDFSFFSIPQKYASHAIDQLCGVVYNQRAVTVKLSDSAGRPSYRRNRRTKKPNTADCRMA